jgi:hypothetical protein
MPQIRNFVKHGLSLLLALLPLTGCGQSGPYNGFDLSAAAIPADEIHLGGPPRDGIPAIDHPLFVTADQAGFLDVRAPVLGLELKGEARAYPVAIMNWHEIVNDQIGGRPVSVTFCPLCGSGIAFAAEAGGRALDFGVSGLLYNSDMLLYDRQTESLWSQLMGRAVSGSLKGTRLSSIPLEHTSWADWRTRHPNTLVLSRETGYRRDYDRDPYAGYETEKGLYFPVAKRDPRYHPKERVLGLELEGRFKAYPFAELSQTTGEVRDKLAGRDILIRFDPAHRSARAFDATGKPLPAVTSFWFAWYAFHPDTRVYQAKP